MHVPGAIGRAAYGRVNGAERGGRAFYTGSEADNEPFTASLQNSHAVVSMVNRFNMVTRGGGNNWVVRLIGHVTINANGDVTASFERETDAGCR